MIAGLKPYSMMKDSGVEWLGEMPEHWELRRTKTLLKQRGQKGFPKEPLLAATQTKGVVRKEQYENRTVLALKDLHLLKLVCVGDFVISLRSFQGGIEYARERGIISPAYTILYPKNPDIHGYFACLFKSKPYVENLTLYVTGIRQGQNIDYEKLSRSELPLPPLPEQTAIVHFLGHIDRRIRRYVRAKQKLIKLLEEQKQAIIHSAVTRGLDPSVILKPSGVEWLGDVPEHWEVRRNGRLFAQRNETGFASLPILEVSLRTGVRVRDFKSADRKQVMSDRDKYKRAVGGDIAYNMMRMWQGAVGVAPTDGLISPAYVVAKPLPGTESRYFIQLFRTAAYMTEIDKYSRGIVKDRNRLYWEDFKRMPSCYPPLHEQVMIADAIDHECEEIDATVKRIRREIELLHEYRVRLIADVVTGKLDVREAVALLPDEGQEALEEMVVETGNEENSELLETLED